MLNIKRLNTADADFWAQLDRRLAWESVSDDAVMRAVRDILAGVRARGDAAVLEYTSRFDRLNVSRMGDLEVSQEQLHAALQKIPVVQREALEFSAMRLRAYHVHQKSDSWS